MPCQNPDKEEERYPDPTEPDIPVWRIDDFSHSGEGAAYLAHLTEGPGGSPGRPRSKKTKSKNKAARKSRRINRK